MNYLIESIIKNEEHEYLPEIEKLDIYEIREIIRSYTCPIKPRLRKNSILDYKCPTESEEDEDSEKENTAEEETTSQSPNQTRANLSQADLERLRVNNSYGQNGNPSYTEVYNESDFLNKNVTVDAHLGEIRTEPNLNSGVAGYVNDGETVYVQEVYNDGGRYWLNIGNGWISSKLITGEFSQR